MHPTRAKENRLLLAHGSRFASIRGYTKINKRRTKFYNSIEPLWRETWTSLFFITHNAIHFCSASNDGLTRILLINWISLMIYGSVVKAARNLRNRCQYRIYTEPIIKVKKLCCLLCPGYRFFTIHYYEISYEKSSVKNCICHNSTHPETLKSCVKRRWKLLYFLRFFLRDKKTAMTQAIRIHSSAATDVQVINYEREP